MSFMDWNKQNKRGLRSKDCQAGITGAWVCNSIPPRRVARLFHCVDWE